MSGMKAMWTGIRFWLIIAIANTPATISHFVTRTARRFADSSVLPILDMIHLANSVGRPELATAMANAPNSA